MGLALREAVGGPRPSPADVSKRFKTTFQNDGRNSPRWYRRPCVDGHREWDVSGGLGGLPVECRLGTP
jgi:hypothetical protein